MCRVLWIPATENDGIPFESLVSLVTAFSQWRDEHLDRVGVPSNFEADWDFVAAVTACTFAPSLTSRCSWLIDCGIGSSDATFHLMWILLSQALEDYGIRESNDLMRGGGGDARTSTGTTVTLTDCDALSHQITHAAQHGALRIAGLVRSPRSAMTWRMNELAPFSGGRFGLEQVFAA